MPDLLVRLYDLPPLAPKLDAVAAQGITVRRAMPYEKTPVLAWVGRTFNAGWRDEADVAFARVPGGCWIATDAGRVVGFACHDATVRGFFGPTGVADTHRRRGIGAALLHACLHAMHGQGYAYAVIGGTSDASRPFYEREAGATVIAGSDPGVYRDGLRGDGPG